MLPAGGSSQDGKDTIAKVACPTSTSPKGFQEGAGDQQQQGQHRSQQSTSQAGIPGAVEGS